MFSPLSAESWTPDNWRATHTQRERERLKEYEKRWAKRSNQREMEQIRSWKIEGDGERSERGVEGGRKKGRGEFCTRSPSAWGESVWHVRTKIDFSELNIVQITARARWSEQERTRPLFWKWFLKECTLLHPPTPFREIYFWRAWNLTSIIQMRAVGLTLKTCIIQREGSQRDAYL